MREVAVDHSTMIESSDHSSTIEKDLSSMIERDLSSTIESVHSSMIGKKKEANGKTTKRMTIPQKMISKDLKDQDIILATDNSEWTKLEINQLRNSITVLPTKLKKRGMKGSIKEIKETDHLKSNSTDEL